VERSPEKAGVGGSIPSLATMFSVIYGPSKTQFHSDSFQNSWPLRFAFAGMRPVWSPFLGAGPLFGPALFISVETSNPVITVSIVITVIARQSLPKWPLNAHNRLSIRSPPAR